MARNAIFPRDRTADVLPGVFVHFPETSSGLVTTAESGEFWPALPERQFVALVPRLIYPAAHL